MCGPFRDPFGGLTVPDMGMTFREKMRGRPWIIHMLPLALAGLFYLMLESVQPSATLEDAVIGYSLAIPGIMVLAAGYWLGRRGWGWFYAAFPLTYALLILAIDTFSDLPGPQIVEGLVLGIAVVAVFYGPVIWIGSPVIGVVEMLWNRFLRRPPPEPI